MIVLLFIISIDPQYHTYEEVAYELDSIAIHYPAIASLDTIGYSTVDSLALFAMKISDNVQVDEDEPAILYIGCHHAEEILGTEICMYMLHDLISRYYSDSSVAYWIDNREIWFVPLMNPDGHSVVMTELDTIWRKNKRDNNNNGFFDLDSDGVDLNRNYDFYWSEGGSSEASSEYYRGPSPFSENEARAVRDLCLEHHFVFCITYHSARTGLGEVVYYPWEYSGGYSPDFPVLRGIADTLSKSIINDAGNGHYYALPGVGVDGRARNWIYGICGTFTYCIEVSTTTIQPGWMVDDICQRNSVGAYYLVERASGCGITGCIYDSLTGSPLRAEVVIQGYHSPMLPPWQSEPMYGRFLRILSPGTYDIEIHKNGYVSQYIYDVIVENDELSQLTISLSKSEYELLKEHDTNSIWVHPNPARNIIFIHLGNPSNFSSVGIYDSAGRSLISFEEPTNDIVWQCIDDTNRKIANGVYYVLGKTIDQRLLQKVVVFR
jgi:carboxypeptidase T